MKRIKKIWLISFLFVIMLSFFPVASSLMFGARESYVSALVSQSSLSLVSGRIHTVTVQNPVTGDREVMSERDYLCGIVASQMPIEYDDEAIKAQAVASYTLIKYRRIYGTPAEAQSGLRSSSKSDNPMRRSSSFPVCRRKTAVIFLWGFCNPMSYQPTLRTSSPTPHHTISA